MLFQRSSLPVIVLSMFLFTSAALSSCSNQEDSFSHLETAGPGWDADFEDLRQRAKGTKDEAITLKNYKDQMITDAELIEAGGRYENCIRDAGFPGYSTDPFGDWEGIINPTPEEEKLFSQASDICSESTSFGWVQMMWMPMRQNPSNINWSELQTACLRKLGIVDSSITGEDIDKMSEDFGRLANERGENGNQEPIDLLPVLVDLKTAREAFHQCVREPQNVLGFSTAKNPQ